MNHDLISCLVCGSEHFVEVPVVSLKNKNPDTSELNYCYLDRNLERLQYACSQCGNELKEGLIDKSLMDIYKVDRVLDKVRLAKVIYPQLKEKLYFILKNKKEAFLFQGYLGPLEEQLSFVRESDTHIEPENIFCTSFLQENRYDPKKNYLICLTENEFDKLELTESGLMETFQDRFNVRFRTS